jgi:hypothetical protein
LQEIKDSIEAESKATIEAAMKDVYARLHEVISHAAERLRAYKVTSDDKVEGRFRDSLITNIIELLDVVPALNLTDDPKLRQFATTIRKEITAYAPEVLRDDERIRTQVASKAEEILKKMEAYL